MGVFNKIGKWAKKQSKGGLSMQGLKSSMKGAVKPKNLGWTLGALTLGASALPGVTLGGMAGGLGNAGKAIGSKLIGLGKPGMGVAGKVGGAVKGMFNNDAGKMDWGKLGKVGMAGMAFKGQRDQQRSQQAYYDQEAGRRDMFTKMALDRNKSSEPYKQKSLEILSKLAEKKSVFG